MRMIPFVKRFDGLFVQFFHNEISDTSVKHKIYHSTNLDVLPRSNCDSHASNRWRVCDCIYNRFIIVPQVIIGHIESNGINSRDSGTSVVLMISSYYSYL